MNGSLKIKDAGGFIVVQKEAPVIIVIMVLKKGTAVEKMVMVVMVIVQSMHWMLFPIPLEHIIHALVVKQVSTLKNFAIFLKIIEIHISHPVHFNKLIQSIAYA